MLKILVEKCGAFVRPSGKILISISRKFPDIILENIERPWCLDRGLLRQWIANHPVRYFFQLIFFVDESKLSLTKNKNLFMGKS